MTAPCPVCGFSGDFIGWRGLNMLFRCSQCGQHFVDDGLGSLEADLHTRRYANEAW